MRFRYLPLYSSNEVPFLQIPFSKFACVTVSLPLFSFIFCIVWSVAYNFEAATFTHCNVYNFLPSVSAAIGSYNPQKVVWVTAISLHALPRFILVHVYQRYFADILTSRALIAGLFVGFLNIIENIALLGLTIWSSNYNYAVHKASFATFVAMSELYMISSCILIRTCKKRPLTSTESWSLRLKWKCLVTNIFAFVLAGYCFNRHNNFCEPMMYSMFALAEYVIVITNMAFHMTATLDFQDMNLVIGKHGLYFT